MEKLLITHKKLIAKYALTKEMNLLTPIEQTGKKLILIIAKYKCQKCGATKDLQRHHLIMKNIKSYCDEIRYHSIRKYWANSLILCHTCHMKIHGKYPSQNPESIPQETPSINIPTSKFSKLELVIKEFESIR